MARCEGLNRNDEQCGNEALAGSRFCHITAHAERPITRGYRFSRWLQSHRVFAVLTVIFLAGAVIGFISFGIQLVTNRESATSGFLSAGSLAPAKYLMLGGALVEEKSRDGIVMKDGDEPILTVHIRSSRSARCLWLWRCQRQMLVSWKSRNSKGEPVAEIKDNEWSHQPRPAIFDRNYTSNILEIRDAMTGRVSLQLVDLGEAVYIAGLFLCTHLGSTFTVGPQGGMPTIEMRPPGAPISLVITPICEYPSTMHLGQCSSKSVESFIKPEYLPRPQLTPIQVCSDVAAEELKKAAHQP
jgi:hypothetical protein